MCLRARRACLVRLTIALGEACSQPPDTTFTEAEGARPARTSTVLMDRWHEWPSTRLFHTSYGHDIDDGSIDMVDHAALERWMVDAPSSDQARRTACSSSS